MFRKRKAAKSKTQVLTEEFGEPSHWQYRTGTTRIGNQFGWIAEVVPYWGALEGDPVRLAMGIKPRWPEAADAAKAAVAEHREEHELPEKTQWETAK